MLLLLALVVVWVEAGEETAAAAVWPWWGMPGVLEAMRHELCTLTSGARRLVSLEVGVMARGAPDRK